MQIVPFLYMDTTLKKSFYLISKTNLKNIKAENGDNYGHATEINQELWIVDTTQSTQRVL